MLDLKKYDVNSNVEGFYFIKEEGYYSGRLCAVRISKQDKQFVEEGKQPRDQISFVFDIINEDGNHVHVQTKPSSITFGERSNIPKLWAKVKELKNGSDLSNFLYKEGGLGKVFKVNVEVTENTYAIHHFTGTWRTPDIMEKIMEKVRVCLIGCGRAGMIHARSYSGRI